MQLQPTALAANPQSSSCSSSNSTRSISVATDSSSSSSSGSSTDELSNSSSSSRSDRRVKRQAAATAGLDDDPTEQLGRLSFRMLVSYDGTAYSGWQLQKQTHAVTIQGEVERALSTVLREGRRCLGVCAAGRTDAGVHARGQVVQFFTNSSSIDPGKFPYKLNSLLPGDIRVFWIRQTAPDFNVTVSALRKTYHYHLDTGAAADPLRSRYCHHPRRPLDLEAMRAGAALLVGRHDFTQFSNNSAERLRRNPVKTLQRLDLVEDGPAAVRLEVTGSGFLYKQVRHMMGALLALGEGRIALQDIASRLAVGNTQPPGAGGFWRGYNVAPAKGLQLFEVQYPPAVDDPSALLYPDLPHDEFGRVTGYIPGASSIDED
uniref:tRNA pseudouridine synthase n=1 Tax=Tetradesmus obliquus TaxID=3088 RepID=A0A383VMC2_TETOB|eukprot:jgi/Sobl393_1/14786/SZX66675.1